MLCVNQTNGARYNPQMFSVLDSSDLPLLSRQLTALAKLPVTVVASIDSTNQYLLSQAQSVPEHPQPPCALLALHQTAGRGRRGKAWESTAVLAADQPFETRQATAFLASLAIRTALPLPALSLLPLHMGVAAAQQLRLWGCPARVKWPNDIEVEGAKLGGILLETRAVEGQTLVVMGLGVNWHRAPEIAGRLTACALPKPVQGAAALLAAMHQAWERTVTGEALEFAALDALHGQTVATLGSAPSIQGTAIGINADGHLGIRSSAGVHWIHSGEVSVVRA
jgi:BirA family transcriptional regulator, biotin operon repressor / biotin---[acetyl-CoA-carboxylase] ligase